MRPPPSDSASPLRHFQSCIDFGVTFSQHFPGVPPFFPAAALGYCVCSLESVVSIPSSEVRAAHLLTLSPCLSRVPTPPPTCPWFPLRTWPWVMRWVSRPHAGVQARCAVE